jgi:hypothetical protein
MDVQSIDPSIVSLDEGGKKPRRPKRKAAPANDTEYVLEASSKPVARKGKKAKGSEQYLIGDGLLLDTADSTQLSPRQSFLQPSSRQWSVSITSTVSSHGRTASRSRTRYNDCRHR